MGHYTDHLGRRAFTPDNTPTKLYIDTTYDAPSFAEILEQAWDHFGRDVSPLDLTFEAEYIHTSCLGYGSYDPGDYTNYLVITRT